MAGSLFDKIKAKLPLDKLKNIKLEIPFIKKKKVEAPVEDAEEVHKKQPDIKLTDKGTHLSDKTDPGVTVPAGDKTEADQSIEKIEEKEKKKSFFFKNLKNTKFSPFKIVVILSVLYLVYDTLLNEQVPEEPVAPPVQLPRKKRDRKKKNADQAAVDTNAAGAVDASGASPPAIAVTPAPDVSPTPTVDNIDVAATPAPEVSVTPEELALPESTSTPKPGDNPLEDLNVEEINKEAEKIEKNKEEQVLETPTPEPTKTTPSLSEIAEDQKEESKGETGEAKEKTEKNKDGGNIADDLLSNLKNEEESGKSDKSSTSELKETPPPDYLRSGRGLVYNCKGKHWACVSRDQYAQCKQNNLWNVQNDKPSECYEISVYATEKDCSSAQKIKIEGLAKTNFCK